MNRKLTSIVAASYFLFSCSSFTVADANRLEKGMSKARILNLISIAPEAEYNLTIETDSKNKFSVFYYDMKVAGTEGIYLVAFKEDSVLYWGYPHEFNRYPNEVINKIGQAAYELIKENN